MPTRADVIILAGGRSRRMGVPKFALPLGETTFLEHLAEQLAEVFSRVIIVGPREHPEAETPLENFDTIVERLAQEMPVTIVRDETPDQGPLEGLRVGLAASPEEVACVVACDNPLLRPEVLEWMAGQLEEFDALCFRFRGHDQPFPSVWRTKTAAYLGELLQQEQRSINSALAGALVKRVHFEHIAEDIKTFSREEFLRNFNSPEEYSSWATHRQRVPEALLQFWITEKLISPVAVRGYRMFNPE